MSIEKQNRFKKLLSHKVHEFSADELDTLTQYAFGGHYSVINDDGKKLLCGEFGEGLRNVREHIPLTVFLSELAATYRRELKKQGANELRTKFTNLFKLVSDGE